MALVPGPGAPGSTGPAKKPPPPPPPKPVTVTVPEPMVTSASTTAPASAAYDAAAAAADAQLPAFFSTGTGPAMHYDLQDQAGPQAAAGGAA